MDIHTLIHKFASLEGANVGKGPRHPDNTEKESYEIESFVNTYPSLRLDQGYIDFLEYYSGVSLLRGNNELNVDVFGFSNISTRFTEEDTTFVSNNGFLMFSYILVHKSHEIDFAFDVSQGRSPGIYRVVDANGEDIVCDWHCATFVEWFSQLVELAEVWPTETSLVKGNS